MTLPDDFSNLAGGAHWGANLVVRRIVVLMLLACRPAPPPEVSPVPLSTTELRSVPNATTPSVRIDSGAAHIRGWTALLNSCYEVAGSRTTTADAVLVVITSEPNPFAPGCSHVWTPVQYEALVPLPTGRRVQLRVVHRWVTEFGTERSEEVLDTIVAREAP